MVTQKDRAPWVIRVEVRLAELGWKRIDLARRMGIDQAHLSHLMLGTGGYVLRRHHKILIALLLEVEVTELFQEVTP